VTHSELLLLFLQTAFGCATVMSSANHVLDILIMFCNSMRCKTKYMSTVSLKYATIMLLHPLPMKDMQTELVS